jgi:hypothetical protein
LLVKSRDADALWVPYAALALQGCRQEQMQGKDMTALKGPIDRTRPLIRDIEILLRRQRLEQTRSVIAETRCQVRMYQVQVLRNQLFLMASRGRALYRTAPCDDAPEGFATDKASTAGDGTGPGGCSETEPRLVAKIAQMGERCRGVIMNEGQYWPQDDAVWTCEHRHETPTAARTCAEIELSRRNTA